MRTARCSPDSPRRGSFNDPATTGTITYTYRIVPQSGLTAAVANQVVSAVAGSLPALPVPTPYVVQTILPDLPNLPGANIPQLPTITVPLPSAPEVVDPNNPTVPDGPDRSDEPRRPDPDRSDAGGHPGFAVQLRHR